MPSQLDNALAELRAARPEAPPELRRRVELIARAEPAPPRRRASRGRLALVLAAGLLVTAVAAAVMRQSPADEQAGEGEGAAIESAPAARDSAAEPTELGARLQDFRAELGVRVDDVSGATQRAMQIASSLGGHVVSASYESGGDSVLVLSVPVARAQDAIARLTQLGELTSQRYSLQDLQETVDALDAQADRLQQRIASLERQLRNPALTAGERTALRARLDQAERELQDVLAQREGTAREGRMAEITLSLTGEPQRDAAGQGVVRDAVAALGTIWAWVLAGVIVAAPFAALLAVALLLGRRLRRRADERLLG